MITEIENNEGEVVSNYKDLPNFLNIYFSEQNFRKFKSHSKYQTAEPLFLLIPNWSRGSHSNHLKSFQKKSRYRCLRKYDTTTALDKAITHILEALKKRDNIMGLFFEMRRAFDNVSHGLWLNSIRYVLEADRAL